MRGTCVWWRDCRSGIQRRLYDPQGSYIQDSGDSEVYKGLLVGIVRRRIHWLYALSTIVRCRNPVYNFVAIGNDLIHAIGFCTNH